MNTILIVLVVLALTGISSCANTQCDLWKNGSEWRCAKDNAQEDRIHIVASCNGCTVTFMVGIWHSKCHNKGTNDKTEAREVSDLGDDIDFPAAANGMCNEIFIFDCKVGRQSRNCADVLRVAPRPF